MDEKDRTLERCIKCGKTLSADGKRNCLKCNPQRTCIFCNGVLGEGTCGGCGNNLSGNFLVGLDDFEETEDTPEYGLTGQAPERTNAKKDAPQENLDANTSSFHEELDSIKESIRKKHNKDRKRRRIRNKEGYKPTKSESNINLSEELHNRRSIASKKDVLQTYTAMFLIKFLTLYKPHPPNIDKPEKH